MSMKALILAAGDKAGSHHRKLSQISGSGKWQANIGETD